MMDLQTKVAQLQQKLKDNESPLLKEHSEDAITEMYKTEEHPRTEMAVQTTSQVESTRAIDDLKTQLEEKNEAYKSLEREYKILNDLAREQKSKILHLMDHQDQRTDFEDLNLKLEERQRQIHEKDDRINQLIHIV